MTTSTSSTLIAFFGATGGCTNAALVLALNAGLQCSCLARTPSKLEDMLVAAGVTKNQISQQLHIIQGDVRTVDHVRQVLNPQGQGAPLASVIVSGIGMQMGKNMDKTLCEDATTAIVEAIGQLEYTAKPLVCLISTTGIAEGKRDVPVLFLPLYHWYLKTPHVDKRKMEEIALKQWSNGLFSGLVLLRPSLLTDGKQVGMAGIRQGDEKNPAVGYTISRKDVGLWIYEKVIKSHFGEGHVAKPVISH